MAQEKKSNSVSLGLEAELFKTADKLRGNMEPSDYKHAVLGLIFLKYILDAFENKYQQLVKDDPKSVESKRGGKTQLFYSDFETTRTQDFENCLL